MPRDLLRTLPRTGRRERVHRKRSFCSIHAVSDLPVSNPVEIDTLNSIENLTGSTGNDRLTGDAGDNRLDGGVGNDTKIERLLEMIREDFAAEEPVLLFTAYKATQALVVNALHR
ncbi:MAG: hypothetical protein KDK75_01930 [Alphaproteobacteria bacterium]|nr:hypothetical protein [Alphaproteobacteria bacterium]